MADVLSPISRAQQAMADSLAVVIASDQSAVAVDTELPAAASLTDNFANPTAPGVGAFGMVWDGATWDRQLGDSTDGTLVNLGTNNDVTVTGAVDTELPAAASLTDNFANPTAPGVGAFLMLWDSATWDRAPGTAADGLLVNLGTNNDVTFSATAPTTPVIDHQTSAALASGASADLDTAEAASTNLTLMQAWSSQPIRVRLYTVDNSVESTNPIAVGGAPQWALYEYTPPHRTYSALGATAGADTWRAEITNLGAAAADVYATFYYEAV